MEYNVDPWYVIHTVPQREQSAALTLSRAGAEVFNPVYRHMRPNGYDREYPVRLPLFPRYIFMRGDIAALWPHITKERAILGPLKTAGSFDTVADYLISEIREREDENGLVRMFELKQGDAVKVINRYPFNGLTGIFQRELKGDQRIAILLQAASGTIEVPLDRSQVIPLSY